MQRRGLGTRGGIALAMALLTLACGATSAGAVPGGTIEGTITDAATDEGIPGLQYVCASDGTHEECEETDADGRYVLSDLPEGDYIVYFEFFDTDYVNQYYNGKPSWEGADPVHVTLGNTVANVNAEMQTGGRVSGTVTRALDGAPLDEIEVCAHEDRAPNYWAVRCGFTDSSGQYTIRGLATGHYKIEFSPDWPGEPDDGFPAQFFDDKASIAEAAWVDVTAPATTAGIDAHLGTKPSRPAVVQSASSSSQPLAPKPKHQRLAVKLTAPRQKLDTIGKTGEIHAKCRLSGPGRCAVVATVSPRVAKALGLAVKKGAKAVTIGKGKTTLHQAGTADVEIALSRKVRAALAEVDSLEVKLTATVGGRGVTPATRSVAFVAQS